MSQWIKRLPLPPIQLAILLLVVYFTIHSFSFLTMGLLSLFLLALFLGQKRQVFLKVLPLLCLFSLFVCFQRLQWQEEDQSAPPHLDRVQLLPDTIQIKGDSLSFRGRADGRLYQVFYQLASQEEQAYFYSLSDTVEIEMEAEVGEAGGQRNFNGFDYQAYLASQGIYRTVTIKTMKEVTAVNSWNPFDWLSSLRKKALDHIRTHFPAPMSHYMTGLLFGELGSEFDQMSAIYSSLGIIHLFALSGMQVGFFVDRFRWLFMRLGLTKEWVDWLQYPFSLAYGLYPNPTDTRTPKPFLQSIQTLDLFQHIVADAGYGSEDNYSFIIDDLEKTPLIPYGTYQKEQKNSYKKSDANPENWTYLEDSDQWIKPAGVVYSFKNYSRRTEKETSNKFITILLGPISRTLSKTN